MDKISQSAFGLAQRRKCRPDPLDSVLTIGKCPFFFRINAAGKIQMGITAGLIDIAALINKKLHLLGDLLDSLLAIKFDQIMAKYIQEIDLPLLGFLHDLLGIAIRLQE